jgi:hypothetical protein
LLLALILLSLLLAWATFRYLETPVRFSPNPILRASWFPLVGLLMLLFIGGLGDMTRSAKGFPGRIDGDAWQGLNWTETQISDQSCLSDLQVKGNYCQRYKSTSISYALIGDSHANHFFPGLAAVVARQGGNLLQIAGPLQLGADPNWSNLEWLIARPEVRTVFIAYHHGRLFQNDNPFAGSVEQMLVQLFNSGKQVYFVIDNPEFDFDPRLCTERPPIAQWLGAGDNAARICTESKEFMRRKRSPYEGYITKLASSYPKLEFIDTFSALCDERQCSSIEGKNLLFRDRHHLTIGGSEKAFSGLTLPSPKPTL